jgi:dihydrofolate reductase
MRKVTYGAACSLDGFIAGPNGEIDWLHFSNDVQAVMADYWSRIDVVLMGRKTWEVANAMGQSGGGSMRGVTGYVFSRTLTQFPSGGGELIREDAGEFVRALKTREGKEICVLGGGELACSLLSAGVIDEVRLNIHPVLLGRGIPLFRDAGRIALTLLENRTIDGGCVLASYGVMRGAARGNAATRESRQRTAAPGD